MIEQKLMCESRNVGERLGARGQGLGRGGGGGWGGAQEA